MTNKKQEESFWYSSQTKTWAFWFMIIMVVVLSFYLIYAVNKGSLKCMANPWSYAISLITPADNKPATCSCTCSFLPPGNNLFLTKDNSTIIDNNYSPLIKP